MKVTLLYFASLRETVGVQRESLELPSHVHTIATLIEFLVLRGPHWAQALQLSKGLKCAVDQEVVAVDTVISNGVEIAFFPPVTGG
jgi:sulfur-carrier protein